MQCMGSCHAICLTVTAADSDNHRGTTNVTCCYGCTTHRKVIACKVASGVKIEVCCHSQRVQLLPQACKQHELVPGDLQELAFHAASGM